MCSVDDHTTVSHEVQPFIGICQVLHYDGMFCKDVASNIKFGCCYWFFWLAIRYLNLKIGKIVNFEGIGGGVLFVSVQLLLSICTNMGSWINYDEPMLIGFVFIAKLCLRIGLLPPVLSRSRTASFSHWKRYQTWQSEKKLDELRRGYIQDECFTVNGMWECECWRHYKTTTNVKLHIRKTFSHKRSLTEHQLPGGIKEENLFGYVQCGIEVPESSEANFANFRRSFKNTLVSKNNIVDLVKTYADERMMS